MVQWDHDLSQFVPMGRATVSEDGAVMVTDAGSGVTKAGWGGACVYDPTKCAQPAPPDCKECGQPTTGDCPSCEPNPTMANKKCENNACKWCRGKSCDKRFEETVPEGVTKLDLPMPSFASMPLPGSTAMAAFNGYVKRGFLPATWKLDAQAFCTSQGGWKFKLSEAQIRSNIVVDPTKFNELTDDEIDRFVNLQPAEACLQTRFGLLALSGGFPTAGRPNNWYRRSAIEAHEQVHYNKFKLHAETNYAIFKGHIEELTTAIRSEADESAKKARDRIGRELEEAIDTLDRLMWEDDQSIDGFDGHLDVVSFHDAINGVLSPIRARLEVIRMQKGCQ